MTEKGFEILYEDNHIIIINKSVSEIVQKDNSGDKSLDEKLKEYLKVKYNKPGNVFIGVVHRLDRPVSGLVVYAKTSKALSRLNALFKNKNITKKYWAIVKNKPPQKEGTLVHFITRNTRQNKAYAFEKPMNNSKESILKYAHIASSDKYHLLDIELITGRHHQIRCQLSKIGCPIKGDLKYGYERSNPDKGISLHARSINFVHPVKKDEILHIVAPVPDEKLWKHFEKLVD